MIILRNLRRVRPTSLRLLGLVIGMLTISLTAGLFNTASSYPDGQSRPARVFESGPGSPPTGIYFDHVVVVMMENEGISDICGGNPPPCFDSNTPYMSSLANNYTLALQYLPLVETSEPNYYGTLGASIYNCTSDKDPNCYPPPGSISALNLVDRFDAANLSWKAYMEDQSGSTGCDTSTHEPYNSAHNGFIWFQDIQTNTTRCNKIALANPSTCPSGVNGYRSDCTLINDLNSSSVPNFMWLTPNDCNNMHASNVCSVDKCTSGGSNTCIKDGDNYLKSLVPKILTSKAFTTQRSALVITFDEGVKNPCPLNGNPSEDCLYTVWAGRNTKTQFSSPTLYDDYSLTKTIEANWNLTALTANDLNATPMSEFFKSDFAISASPTTLTIPAAATANSTVTLSGINSFAGNVTLTATSSPTGVALTSNPTSVTVTAGGTGTSTLSMTPGSWGNFTVTVIGTSGSLSHNTTISIIAQDFQITSNPTSLRPNKGTNSSSTITISPLNHFAGPVSLLATGTTGLNTSITPATISLGSGTATLTVASSTFANYTAVVSASSGNLLHSITIEVQVVDFTITATQPPATRAGTSATSNITIVSLNHFNGNVSLTDNPSPGFSCGTVTPSTLTGSGTATVSCTASVAGNYTIVIAGTSGSLVRSTIVRFTFQDFNITANPTTIVVTDPTATSTIQVTALNGFGDFISLATNSTMCTLTPENMTGSGFATLSCSGNMTSYVVTITGTDGTLSHTVSVSFSFQSGTVGGVSLPIDKIGLVSQFLPLVALILIVGLSSFAVKYRRRLSFPSRVARFVETRPSQRIFFKGTV